MVSSRPLARRPSGSSSLPPSESSSSPTTKLTAGQRCWLILDRYWVNSLLRQRRVLVEVVDGSKGRVRVVNTERTRTFAASTLEPLTKEERESLDELDQLGADEVELAKVFVALAHHGCTLGDVRFHRQRDGQIDGERKAAAPKPHLGCSKTTVRLGKMCASPGCTFYRFHDGPCSTFEEPKKRRCAAPDRLQASGSGKAARSQRQSLGGTASER